MKQILSPKTSVELVTKAILYAQAAHEGQKRKYTGEPYWQHPMEVMQILERYDAPPVVRAAAMLHDVLEDTPVTMDQLTAEFGIAVSTLVMEVTDVSAPEDGNRAQRKRKDLVHLSKASPWAAMIKLADMISNTRSIVEHDPDFARVYLLEKEDLLKVLRPADLRLTNEATEVLWQAKRKIAWVA